MPWNDGVAADVLEQLYWDPRRGRSRESAPHPMKERGNEAPMFIGQRELARLIERTIKLIRKNRRSK